MNKTKHMTQDDFDRQLRSLIGGTAELEVTRWDGKGFTSVRIHGLERERLADSLVAYLAQVSHHVKATRVYRVAAVHTDKVSAPAAIVIDAWGKKRALDTIIAEWRAEEGV